MIVFLQYYCNSGVLLEHCTGHVLLLFVFLKHCTECSAVQTICARVQFRLSVLYWLFEPMMLYWLYTVLAEYRYSTVLSSKVST